MGSLSQTGLLFWSQITALGQIHPVKYLWRTIGEPLSQQRLLGKSSVSTDHSVEDPVGLLQHEITWNFTWISAEQLGRDHNHSGYVFLYC